MAQGGLAGGWFGQTNKWTQMQHDMCGRWATAWAPFCKDLFQVWVLLPPHEWNNWPLQQWATHSTQVLKHQGAAWSQSMFGWFAIVPPTTIGSNVLLRLVSKAAHRPFFALVWVPRPGKSVGPGVTQWAGPALTSSSSDLWQVHQHLVINVNWS